MGDVPRWEERGLRALHACSSEQPPPGKLLQTELHPGDAGEAVGGREGPRGAERVMGSQLHIPIARKIPFLRPKDKQTHTQTLYSLLVLLSRFPQGLPASGILWSHKR